MLKIITENAALTEMVCPEIVHAVRTDMTDAVKFLMMQQVKLAGLFTL